MALAFTKMHGIGNDYVLVLVEAPERRPGDPGTLARSVSDRHLGVGADGLILVLPPRDQRNDFRMEMYNADGSRAQMCGNGIRCVARLVHDRGLARRTGLRVETDAGVRELRVITGATGVAAVEVDMGPPRLERRSLPLVDGGNPEEAAIDLPLDVRGREIRVTAVSMGNPHAVVRVDTGRFPPLREIVLEEWGPLIEHHAWFTERTNTEFIALRSAAEMDLRVWERGSGETLACGTGACAAVVAGVLNGWCDRRVTVHLRGGDLEIDWRPGGGGGTVLMTGPAEEVFRGEWPE